LEAVAKAIYPLNFSCGSSMCYSVDHVPGYSVDHVPGYSVDHVPGYSVDHVPGYSVDYFRAAEPS